MKTNKQFSRETWQKFSAIRVVPVLQSASCLLPTAAGQLALLLGQYLTGVSEAAEGACCPFVHVALVPSLLGTSMKSKCANISLKSCYIYKHCVCV